MDARVANADNIGDVGVAEAVVTALDNERARATQDFVGGGLGIGHGAFLPSSRQTIKPRKPLLDHRSAMTILSGATYEVMRGHGIKAAISFR